MTYKIAKTLPLKVEEACVGISMQALIPKEKMFLLTGIPGAKCGGTTIDRNFHFWMGNQFGEAFKEIDASRIGAGSRFMKQFEDIKRSFDDEENGPFLVHLAMDCGTNDHYDPSYYEVMISRQVILNHSNGLMKQQTPILS